MKMGHARLLIALALGLLLLGACDDETKRTLTPPDEPEYLANDSPDNVVANLVMAWEAMDSLGYAALLYDGVELATDGEFYRPFMFYYDRSLDPDLPEYDLFERELQRASGMMGGLPGQDSVGNIIPGIKSISITLTPNGVWANPINPGGVDGDPYPLGTKWRRYEADILVTLKANIGDTQINGWLVQTSFFFHCIPVQAEGGTRWMLWKWREVNGRGTESTSWGAIKVLYGP